MRAVSFRFADIDAFPLCLRTKDVDYEFVEERYGFYAGVFGAVNLEDISAPAPVSRSKGRLRETCDIPGLPRRPARDAGGCPGRADRGPATDGPRDRRGFGVVNGAGAAAIAVTRLLLKAGVSDTSSFANSKGAIFEGRAGLNPEKMALASLTNRSGKRGGPRRRPALRGSVHRPLRPGALTPRYGQDDGPEPIVFAMCNPEAGKSLPIWQGRAGAAVVGTGRSDVPTQTSQQRASLSPGILRGGAET